MLLLPPSEGKATGGDGPPWRAGPRAFPALERRRARVRGAVRRALREADAAGASRLLAARGATLEAALADWRALDRAPTLPAWRRYDGVVWRALAPGDLSPAAHAALLARVLVPSGLWGLSGAGDPLPAYRLKMGATVPGLGGLAAFWRPALTRALRAAADGGWIVDLLPAEHAAALDRAALGPARVVRVDLRAGDAEGPAAGHAGKHAKGLLAREVLESGARAPEEVAALTAGGALRTVAIDARPAGATVVMALAGAAGSAGP